MSDGTPRRGWKAPEIWYEDRHLHGDRLVITGAISDPRARTIGPRPFAASRFGQRPTPPWPVAIAAMVILALSAVAWGLVYMAVWAIACLWRWAEPLAAIIGIGAALAAIIVGIGLPG